MKKLAFLSTFLLSAVVTFAQQAAPPPASDALQSQQPAYGTDKAASTKQVTGQVVSIDVPAKTITLKKDGSIDPASPTTLPVEASAVATLKTLVPGEKVKLMCKTDNSGKELVQSIEKEKDKPSKTNPQ